MPILRLVLAAIVSTTLLAGCQGDDAPAAALPTEVATAFVEAYGGFDTDAASSYLAADADLSSLEGGQENWRLGNQWMKAQGFQLMLDPCQELKTTSSETVVRCPFDYHAIRSDEIGLGPFGGSHLDLTVLNGDIVSASLSWEFLTNGFSTQVWEPFAVWVSQTYPEDAAVMYVGDAFYVQQLTEESIRLWEQRSKEYVEAVNGG